MFQLLNFLLICPLIGALVIAFIPSWNIRFIKTYALFISITNFIASLSVWLLFDTSTAKFQFVDRIAWLPFLNMNVYIGIDGISLFFHYLDNFSCSCMSTCRMDQYYKACKRVLYSFSYFRNLYACCFLYA